MVWFCNANDHVSLSVYAVGDPVEYTRLSLSTVFDAPEMEVATT
jgi:hypothetical protein